jgi:hypothetical protein
MGNVAVQLAAHRVAYCFESVDNGTGYREHLGAAWAAVESSVRWENLDPWSLGIVPVFTGRILDRRLAQQRFGHLLVEGVLFGLPSAAHAQRAAERLSRSECGVTRPSRTT